MNKGKPAQRLAALVLGGVLTIGGQFARADGISQTPEAKGRTDGNTSAAEVSLRAATEWVRNTPAVRGNYEYAMTARLRLLFFWVTRNDVGGATIRRGAVVWDLNGRATQDWRSFPYKKGVWRK